MRSLTFFSIFFITAIAVYSQVVINEVHMNPAGSSLSSNPQNMVDCTPTPGAEYVELYNKNPCASVDISCYIIAANVAGTSTTSHGAFRFPAGTVIPPLGFVSIGGENSGATFKLNNYCGTANLAIDPSGRWYLPNGDGYLILYDASGANIDAVYWTFSAGQANLWGTNSDFKTNPSRIPAGTGGCPPVTSLSGPANLPASAAEYIGQASNNGFSTSRQTDGSSTWVTNVAGTINACNGACVVATPFHIPASVTQPGCSSNNGLITINPNPAGAYTYTWSPNVSTSNSAANLGGGTYSISISSNGCTKDTVITLTAPGSPTVSVHSATICAGNKATLAASGATTYSWSPSLGLSATTGVSVTASPTVTSTYTVVGITATCTNSATASVTINPTPTISINSATICPGSSATLSASGASSYTWSPSATLSSSNGSGVTASPASTTIYTISGTSNFGCLGSNTVSVFVGGSISPTVNSPIICTGNPTTLTASGGSTYTWSPAVGLSATSGTSVTANPTVSTTYTVLAASGACTGSVTSIITVNSIPVLTVNSSSVCFGSSTTLTASGAFSYSWSPALGLNSTSLTMVTANPGASTIYTVTGTAATCTSSITSTVTVNPLPTITVNSETICTHGTATLTASGANTYTWNTSAVTSSITNSPNISTTYSVSGTSLLGCVNTATAAINVLSNVSLSVNSSTLCLGGSATLNVSGASTYTWMPNTSLNSSNGSSVIANPNSTTTYTIIGASGTCSATTTSTVNVNTLPLISVTSGTICAGSQSATLTASGASTYSWTPSLGLNSSSGASVISNAANTTTYTVTGVDVHNCSSSKTTKVSVHQPPVITVNSATICSAQSATLSATGASSYTWIPTTALNNNIGATVVSNPSNSISYTVTGTDVNSCIGRAITTVSIINTPTLHINNATICTGKSVLLNASGTSTYAWSPSTGLNNITGATVIANPGASTTYTVIGSIGTCTTLATAVVSVYPLPLVSINPKSADGCAPFCTSFTNTLSGINNGSTFIWNFGNGNTSFLSSPSYCFNTQGNYMVLLSVKDTITGCVNTSTASVIVYPVPDADFYATPQPTTILDNTIHFYDNSTGLTITSWNWNLGNGTFSSLQNPICIYNDTGSYSVQCTVTNNYGCKSTVTKPVIIDDYYGLFVPSAFTPNSDGLNDVFCAKGEGIKDFKMYIFDRWGLQLFYSDDLNKGWDGNYKETGIKAVQEDVYVWKIKVQTLNGYSKELSGQVSLIK